MVIVLDYDLLQVAADVRCVAAGLLPGFSRSGQSSPGDWDLGAAVMPHAIYLHCALT